MQDLKSEYQTLWEFCLHEGDLNVSTSHQHVTRRMVRSFCCHIECVWSWPTVLCTHFASPYRADLALKCMQFRFRWILIIKLVSFLKKFDKTILKILDHLAHSKLIFVFQYSVDICTSRAFKLSEHSNYEPHCGSAPTLISYNLKCVSWSDTCNFPSFVQKGYVQHFLWNSQKVFRWFCITIGHRFYYKRVSRSDQIRSDFRFQVSSDFLPELPFCRNSGKISRKTST